MKKLFKMVRQGNLDEIKRILEKNPELINCIEKAPPKPNAEPCLDVWLVC